MPLEALARTLQAAQATANLLRLSMDGQANQQLIEIVDGLGVLLTDLSARQAEVVGTLLSRIVSAQERGDPIGVADLLEFELLPALRAPVAG